MIIYPFFSIINAEIREIALIQHSSAFHSTISLFMLNKIKIVFIHSLGFRFQEKRRPWGRLFRGWSIPEFLTLN